MPLLTELPKPVLFIGAAHSGKSISAMDTMKKTQGADIIGTCDPADPFFTEKITNLKKFRPSTWSSHDSATNLLQQLSQCQHSQILIDSASQWLAHIALSSTKEHYEAIDQEIKEHGLQLAQTIVDMSDAKNITITTAEAGYDFSPQNPVSRILRNRICELNKELARISRSVVHVVAGIPHVIKK
ncbi:MAG: bifunctional adenosylcobinamide kinase/adenosylcobinamide-phosphate guanylyltransferase [Oligoflexales bacterium]